MFKKPLRVHIYRCCDMPTLYTVKVRYLILGVFLWDSEVATNLTREQVESLSAPNVEIWTDKGGPMPTTNG